MNGFRPGRPSPALVVSTVALVVALGGTAYAGFTLPRNSVGTGQLKRNAVTTSKIKNGAVTGSKIKLKTVGTVPSAAHANTADTAANANHSAEATIGDSPIAWAQVTASGTVVAGRGITSANVSRHFTSAYCFHGLAFPFKSAAATTDYASIGAAGATASFALGSPFGDCAAQPGTQAEVSTSSGTSFVAEPFFIQFFN
jgi:hypothetical protein